MVWKGGNRAKLEMATDLPVLTIAQARRLFILDTPASPVGPASSFASRYGTGVEASPVGPATTLPPSASPPEKPELYLVGHDFKRDFTVLRESKIDFNMFNVKGIIDTYVWMEDLEQAVKHGIADEFDFSSGGKSLSHLVVRYGVAKQDYGATKFSYVDCHNGGNDSIVNLHIVPHMVFDPLLDPSSYRPQSEDHHFKFIENASLTSLYTTQDEPLFTMNTNMILLCFDYEGIEGKTSEWGFAWWCSSIIRRHAPATWRDFTKARHYLHDKYWNVRNRYTHGNPHSFWRKYGTTQRYYEATGSRPFQALLAEILSQQITSFTPPSSPVGPEGMHPLPPQQRRIIDQPISVNSVEKPLSSLTIASNTTPSSQLVGPVRPLLHHQRHFKAQLSPSSTKVDAPLPNINNAITLSPSPVGPGEGSRVLPHMRPPKSRSSLAVPDIDDQPSVVESVRTPSSPVHPPDEDEDEDEDENENEDNSSPFPGIGKDDYTHAIMTTCPESLLKRRCTSQEACQHLYTICKDFADPNKTCPHTTFIHGTRNEYLHILPTCKSTIKLETCRRGSECPFGHDNEQMRFAIDRHRRLLARFNALRYRKQRQ